MSNPNMRVISQRAAMLIESRESSSAEEQLNSARILRETILELQGSEIEAGYLKDYLSVTSELLRHYWPHVGQGNEAIDNSFMTLMGLAINLYLRIAEKSGRYAIENLSKLDYPTIGRQFLARAQGRLVKGLAHLSVVSKAMEDGIQKMSGVALGKIKRSDLYTQLDAMIQEILA